MKFGQGNVFTHVCHSVHGGWSLYGVTSCLAAWSHVPSGGGLCLWSHVPSGGSLYRGGLCHGDTLPLGRDPPPYGEERVARILLECSLVFASLFSAYTPTITSQNV